MADGSEDGGSRLPARRLPDAEVKAILARAARTETAPGLPTPHDPTLTELMEAAEEAGLDPAAVRRAAALSPDPSGGLVRAIFGAPDRQAVTARLEGASVPEARDVLVRAAQEILERRGEVVESDPRGFLWKESHGVGRTTVRLEEAEGALEISVEADRAGHYLVYWLVGLMGWLMVTAALGTAGLMPSLGALGHAAALIGVPILFARPFWTRLGRRTARRLERLTMELARISEVEASSPQAMEDGDAAGQESGDAASP